MQARSNRVAFRLWRIVVLAIEHRSIPRCGTDAALGARGPIRVRLVPYWFAHIVNLNRKVTIFSQPILNLGSGS